MMTMARAPILPASPADPTGVDRVERGAMLEFGRRLRKIRDAYVAALERIPAEPAVNKRYAYRLDQAILALVLGDAARETDAQLLEGGEHGVWFFSAYVLTAYQRGTAQTFANLAQQSVAYKAGQDSLANILRSDPYRRRIALIAAREYEEMQGLSGAVKANMARILTDGIGRGKSPRVIAKALTEQAGIEARRANRIARTEITMALRRARWDESDEAAERYGLRTKLMHYSALSPTTRESHAARHAKLYTSDEVRDWYSEGANSINCKCSQVEVLVDADGKPLAPAVIERAKSTKTKMEARGYAWAKE
nr:phage head morphogenesis protein [Gammaproteobacteria bacterium]